MGTQIDLVKTQLAHLNARSIVLQNKLGMIPQQAMAVSSLNQSAAVQGGLADLQEIQRKLAEARSIYADGVILVTRPGLAYYINLLPGRKTG